MREALFAALEHRLPEWSSLRVLDLYAGSGAVGLEAASRGAAEVVLVDRAAPALRVLNANREAIAGTVAGSIEIEAVPVERFVTTPGRRFDVVFADPPYSAPASTLGDVLAALRSAGGLADGAFVIVERSTRDEPWAWPDGFVAELDKAYGEATLWYGREAADGS